MAHRSRMTARRQMMPKGYVETDHVNKDVFMQVLKLKKTSICFIISDRVKRKGSMDDYERAYAFP